MDSLMIINHDNRTPPKCLFGSLSDYLVDKIRYMIGHQSPPQFANARSELVENSEFFNNPKK